MYNIRKKFGLGDLVTNSNLFENAVDAGVLNPNNTSLQDFDSFVVTNPDLVDPSIDVSGLRTTTDANILGNITDYPGIQYEAYNPNRLSDLMRLYSSGLPTLATDTAQIPGVVDTLVDAGSGGGMDQATGDSMLDAPTDGLTQSGTFGDQPTFTTVPGTTVDDVTGDITNPDGSYGGNIVDEFATPPSGITGDPIEVGIPDNESGFVDPLGTIGGAPVVSPVLTNQGPTTIEGPLSQVTVGTGLSQTEKDKLAGYTPSFETPEQQQSFLENVLGRAGQTVDNALTELGKVPGAVVDFANQTVDIFGEKLNVGKTLASAAINKVVGGPISLVFDAIGSLASNLPSGISETTNKAREVGLLVGDGTVTQDKYGINTQSAFGNYNEYNIERVEFLENKTNKTPKDIKELEERKNYIEKTGAAGDITPDATPTDIDTGNVTGDASVAEKEAQKEKQQAFADIQNQIGQSLHGVDDNKDEGPSGPPSGPGDTSDGGFGDTEGKRGGDPYGGGPGGVQSGVSGGSVSTGGPPSQGGSSGGPPGQGGGSSGGGGKIVCTMMNESYGFGSFRNKIWLKHSKNLAPEYQIGYHKIFLPLVRLSKTNKVLKKILEHIAVHRTIDIRQESRGKVHLLGRLYRKVLEPICYWVGKYAK